MRTIILQNVSSKEIREVSKAIALFDKDDYELIRLDISELKQHRKELIYGAVPVGSVEFCREAMKVVGIREPYINSYPNISWIPYYRIISKLPVSVVLDLVTDKKFIKPTKVKRFNGFVYDRKIPVMELDDYTKEQVKVLLTLPDNEEIWLSDVVDFLSEFRYYIDNGEIVGFARYDDSEEEGDHLIPDLTVVKNFASKLSKSHPYVLDFGVLSSGETALVEYNAFYAIGLYPDAITAKKYLELLVKYWDHIRSI